MKSRILKSLLYLFLAAFLYLAIFFIFSYQVKTTKYKNNALQVTLEYPKGWKAAGGDYIIGGHPSRYEGIDGFFEVAAINGQDKTIDDVAADEAGHKLNPYGSSPETQNLRINRKEFVFIYPSTDQPIEMNNQACFIVQYPDKIIIDSDEYNYFILWADRDHIEKIAESFNFISY